MDTLAGTGLTFTSVRFDECALCELVGPIAHLLDVDANIVSWMPLVFNFEPSPLNLLSDLLQLVVVLA